MQTNTPTLNQPPYEWNTITTVDRESESKYDQRQTWGAELYMRRFRRVRKQEVRTMMIKAFILALITIGLLAGLVIGNSPHAYAHDNRQIDHVTKHAKRFYAERRQAVRARNYWRARAGSGRGVLARQAAIYDALAQCESGGAWHQNTHHTYDGGVHFLPSTWSALSAGIFGQYAWQASPLQQAAVAQLAVQRYGWASQFPGCSSKLGYR
jgi:hypothetical protein